MGRKLTVTVRLTEAEQRKLTLAAEQVGVDLALYLRATALNAAREVTDPRRPTYTREQLMSIYRRASLKGHVWTEEELRARALPLYWCEAWVRERLALGYTRVQIAAEAGFPERSATAFLRRVYGLREFRKVGPERGNEIRAAVAAGQSRDEVARAFGVSVNAVAGYARHLPGEVERQFLRVVEAVGEWPASRARIAEASFEGDGPAAAAWLAKKMKRGWIIKERRGVYGLGLEGPHRAGGAASSPVTEG